MILTYSEMQAIASGNPLIKEKISLDNDISTLKLLESEHKQEMFKMQELAERKLPDMIEEYANLLEKASKDLKAFQEQNPENTPFKITINNVTFAERTEAGKALEKAILKCATTGETQNIGEYFGLKLTVNRNSELLTNTACHAALKGNLTYTSDVETNNPLGNIKRIENIAGLQINNRISQLSASLDKAKSDLELARANISKPFERAAELEEKLKRVAEVNAKLSISSPDDDIPVDDTISSTPPALKAAENLPVRIPIEAVAERANVPKVVKKKSI